MLKLASLSLVAILALTSPALTEASKAPAQKQEAPAARVCKAPDALIAIFTKTDAVVVEELTGDELKKFNAAYAKATGQEAPDSIMDRVVVFASKADPDADTYLAMFSKDNCVVAAQPISKKIYNRFRHPDEGI